MIPTSLNVAVATAKRKPILGCGGGAAPCDPPQRAASWPSASHAVVPSLAWLSLNRIEQTSLALASSAQAQNPDTPPRAPSRAEFSIGVLHFVNTTSTRPFMVLATAMAGPGAFSTSACHRQPFAAAASISSMGRRTPSAHTARQHRCRAERQHEPLPLLRGLPPAAGLLAAALLLAAPAPAAHAYNVRLEDVDSPTMQAGEALAKSPACCRMPHRRRSGLVAAHQSPRVLAPLECFLARPNSMV